MKFKLKRAQGECLGASFDDKTRAEVQALLDKEDKSDLIDAFYRDLEFGTGGLRGIMGAGTNRMNIYTLMPLALNISATVSANRRPLLRQSWPTTTEICFLSLKLRFR